jgi:hypothetical protein
MTHWVAGWVGHFHQHLIAAQLVRYQLMVALGWVTFQHVFYENTTLNNLFVCMELFIVGGY